MRFSLPRRRLWRAAIYLASAALVVTAADMIWVERLRSIPHGFDVTRIVGPQLENGGIDYVLAVDAEFGAGVTPENNAAVPWVQAMGPEALAQYQRPGLMERLETGPLPEGGAYLTMYGAFAKGKAGDVEPEQLDLGRPIAVDRPIPQAVSRWVEANEQALALIEEGSRRPRFFIPFFAGHRTETMIEILLPYLHRLREGARALRVRAVMHVQAGDISAARSDLGTLHRMARLIAQAPTMVDHAVAMSIEEGACQAERAVLATGKVPLEDTAAMAAELGAMGDVGKLEDCLDRGERFFALDTLQALAQGGPTRAGELLRHISVDGGSQLWPATLFRLIPIRYEAVMRDVNHVNDGALAAMRQPTYPRRRAALALWEAQVQPAISPSELATSNLCGGNWPRRLFVVSWDNMVRREEKARVERELTRTAAGLAGYRSLSGRYPASLAELKMARAPRDGFADGPLIYRASGNGYVLYSVGPNLVDDGGKGDDVVACVPTAVP